jgi:hypothetical protein
MKIILALQSGFRRSVRAWKGIVIFWFVSLLTASLIVVPLKASLQAAFGSSMITEKLMRGIDVDVLGDLGTNLHSMLSSLYAGILILSLTAIFFNIFIAGGLFNSLRNVSGRFTAENFFSASAKCFRSYLIISLIIYLITITLLVVVVVIPVSVVANAESAPEGMVFRTLDISLSVFLLAMYLMFLVADYARAWQVTRLKNDGFRALGFGFVRTFKTFLSSYPLILIFMVFQAVLVWIMIKIIAGFIPSKEGGVILLFIVSQLVFFFKIFLKVLRYGSVTSLMEQDLSETKL